MDERPPHPGEYILHDCLEPLGLSVTRGAQALAVSRKTLSAIVNGRANVTPRIALRLARAFGSTPSHWLRLQNAYSLWEEAQTFDPSAIEVLHRLEDPDTEWVDHDEVRRESGLDRRK